jgi:hypothetical protein
MGHSQTPTQNTAGDGCPADPIDGSGMASAVCAVALGYSRAGGTHLRRGAPARRDNGYSEVRSA